MVADECLKHRTLFLLHSGLGLAAEKRQNDTAQTSSERLPASTANKMGERKPTQVDMNKKDSAGCSSDLGGQEAITENLIVKSVLSSSSVVPPMNRKNTSLAAYNPGIEEDVLLKSQASKTALPYRSAKPDIPQPLAYGLVFEDNHDHASGSEQEATEEKPAVRRSQGSEARASTESGRALQPKNSATVRSGGLSVAGPRRRPSERQRNGVSKSKASGPPSVASHHRRPSASDPGIESSAGNRRSLRIKARNATANSLEDQ